ncbi:MAG: quinone-dependent dihydroorotate dehydrogenase [Moorea sp. SIOASIH]|uniref:quinone-dependent dihydroorotate dehydrogenase n=1 Tax=Moorena sp. SIOASIH TaxID=2607817 RepID=UPI0013B60DB1|nr:quinone-dependent dihydroorotate dehydrogenase [Moorena sp. SIOASIH]NEO35191.1 quinone-dependent dihydroorotate dehydrogenase [Moorena sp. SIOASIH]
MDIYQSTIRPILFSGLKTDPEWLHNRTLALLSWLSSNQESTLGHWVKGQLQQRFCLNDARLEQTLWGVNFPNPMGLAAGFDKDGVAAGIWGSLGFGFAELGTVTFHGQPGNPRPRLFRLVEDKAALNRMGFNNLGATAMAARLEQLKVNRLQVQPPLKVNRLQVQPPLKVNRLQVTGLEKNLPLSNPKGEQPTGRENRIQASGLTIPIGINLGKSKVTPLAEAADDYRSSFGLLRELGDYFVVNVSSPNTPGLRSLQDASQLSLILDALQQQNLSQKPILVKIAPDLEWNAIADVLELAQTYGLAGIIATNTTIRRDLLKTQRIAATGKPVTEEAGGISGAPLRQRSTDVIRFIWQETQGTLPIIGVGGIFTAEDAWEKITAGASLIQVYTGWIYNGPWMVRQILQGLLQKLEERGISSISEAVGSGSG